MDHSNSLIAFSFRDILSAWIMASTAAVLFFTELVVFVRV